MNINQKQIVLDKLQEIQNTDMKSLLVEAYPSEIDFSKISITKYTAAEFVVLFNKMIVQLKNEIEGGLGLLLPFAENYSNDYGAVNLQNDLTNAYTYLTTKQFTNLEPLLDKLIHYEIKNGFWEKSKVKAHNIQEEALIKQGNLIALNQKALDTNLKAYKLLQSNIEKTIAELNHLIAEKKQELTQITASVITATTQLAEINTSVSSATNKETEITGILKNLNEKVSSTSETIAANDETFLAIKADAKILVDTLSAKIVDANTNISQAKKDFEFIDGKKSQIELLTGMAADGSLGSKFHQRQEKLEISFKFWKWAVPITSIITLTWILVVFNYMSMHFDNQWLNILINLIKTTPAFILLGFVFSQYSKERNLQEEYAFKSAVAMTLTAYSEMLAGEDDENNVSRQQMLLKSIEMVYNQPHIYSLKNERIFSFNTKKLKETVETLSDAVKNIKST